MKQRLVIAAVVREGRVIAYAMNQHDCARLGFPTGKGYELCKGCDYPNHAERKAIEAALLIEPDLHGAIVLVVGHDYACGPCITAAKNAGIEKVRIFS